MESFLAGTLATFTIFNFTAFASDQDQTPQPKEIIEVSQPLTTETKFEIKFATSSASINFKKEYKDDPETEAGIETVIQKGEDGKKLTTIKITLYDGKEFAKDIVGVKTEKPVNEIISRGTKIVWKTLQTPDGEIRYWKKIRVYATHYDQHCLGCNEWTAIGMRAGKGVIAVDPKVIKLRSNVYVPGYGKAVAGDTGGAIKGNIIDLGFDDARTAGWSARYVDIYLL